MKWLSSDNYSIPTLLALGLHGVIIVAGLVTVNFSEDITQEPKRPVIVNATVIDISQTIIGQRESKERIAKQHQAAAAAEKKRKDVEQKKKDVQRKALKDKQRKLARVKQAEEKAAAESLKREQAKKQDAKQKRLAQEVEKKRLVEEAEKKAQKAEDEKKRQEQAKKIEAERLVEQKRQEEAARQAEQKEIVEAVAKAAAEADEQRAAEEAQIVESISSLINKRLAEKWTRPPSARNGMKTTLRISFLPTGEVLEALVVSSSGDPFFDRNTINAARKIRIEEMSNIEAFTFNKIFRDVIVIFNPQDLRN